VPRWNETLDPLGYWPATDGLRNTDEFIGASFSLAIKAMGTAGDETTVDFDSAATNIRIPHGRRMLFIVNNSNGQPLSGVNAAYYELKLSSQITPPNEILLEIR
jgi:hypothetical protein